jgi:large subunit ribosomal protein L17
MRHGVKKKKLGRRREHREAMLANMAASLFVHRRITTTLPKAKLVRPFVDKLATLAKRGDLAARRLAASRLRDPGALKTLFDEHVGHWSERTSGFTRWARLGQRKGDGAEMAVVELLVPVAAPEKETKEGKEAKAGAAKRKTPAKAQAKSGKAKAKKAAA